MITTMLFDIDGVIITGELWSKKLARTHGIHEEVLAPFFQGPFQACLIGQADLKEELARYLPRWGWTQSVEAFLDYWFRQEHTINEQLLQVVQQLRQRGIKCYLATQQERYRTTYFLREMSFPQQFDGMFSSVDLGYMKNNPAFFETVLRKIDCSCPDEVLFWDDTPANVATARSVGMRAEVYSDFVSFLLKIQEEVEAIRY